MNPELVEIEQIYAQQQKSKIDKEFEIMQKLHEKEVEDKLEKYQQLSQTSRQMEAEHKREIELLKQQYENERANMAQIKA